MNDANPIILSICMTAYNRADLLRDTLSRLKFLNQWPISVELVVADNGSKDHTWRVIKAMQAELPMLRPLRYASNIGQYRCQMSLFRNVRGRYTLYLADDDHFIQESVLAIVQFMESNPRVVGCYSPIDIWDDLNEQVVASIFHFKETKLFKKQEAFEMFKFVTHHAVVPEHAVYRTEALVHCSYYFTNFY
ncbi:MAG: glycosyltransferase family 2 protein, partial [Magnetococcales bacterium]|nr:glycosyltransferase family 2 protein [Magnetococcales bacterium]